MVMGVTDTRPGLLPPLGDTVSDLPEQEGVFRRESQTACGERGWIRCAVLSVTGYGKLYVLKPHRVFPEPFFVNVWHLPQKILTPFKAWNLPSVLVGTVLSPSLLKTDSPFLLEIPKYYRQTEGS